ncbi:MAG: TerB N-terminal domain-containing protein [Clostridia bacterium]|nr:TerB N-terminal domain-containing protein [Clostridia bacterium]
MDPKEQKKKDEELDRFWDIDALIPPRRVPHYTADTETAEIVLEPTDTGSGEEKMEAVPKRADEPERRFVPPHTADEVSRALPPDEEYFPENMLIRTVRIFKTRSNYSYYDGFIRDADRLFAVKGEKCEHVPFFSYVPQYTQMSRPQLEWYLWWRECFRCDEILTTDYSYLLLYAYELINLSEKLEPLYVQRELCRLWLRYRDMFHQLDTHLPEWICDHSLLHRLPPPEALHGQLLYTAMSHCTLKEFYITAAGDAGLLRGMLVFCSNYDYHKSKFCTPEHKKLFRDTILGALREALEKTSEDGTLLNLKGMDPSRMVRDSYNGALCAYRIRRRIAVEYSSFNCSHDLRYLITDIVKYTENHLRMFLGVRSRLSIYALPARVREILDAYLEARLPRHRAVTQRKNAEEIAYERLYDVPRNPLSLANAASIERASWDTTERLVEAFGDAVFAEDEETTPMKEARSPTVPALPAETPQNVDVDAFLGEMRPYLPFLAAVLRNDPDGQCAAAEKSGTLEEIVADEINGIAAEYTGDILLEEAERGFSVIGDYRTLAEELLERGRE